MDAAGLTFPPPPLLCSLLSVGGVRRRLDLLALARPRLVAGRVAPAEFLDLLGGDLALRGGGVGRWGERGGGSGAKKSWGVGWGRGNRLLGGRELGKEGWQGGKAGKAKKKKSVGESIPLSVREVRRVR